MAFYGNGANITNIPEPAELSTASGSAPSYAGRAWVQFNGVGTVSIRAQGNVSSITDHQTGQWTMNFSTAMPDANYSAAGGCFGDGSNWAYIAKTSNNASISSSALRFGTGYSNGDNYSDVAHIHMMVFR